MKSHHLVISILQFVNEQLANIFSVECSFLDICKFSCEFTMTDSGTGPILADKASDNFNFFAELTCFMYLCTLSALLCPVTLWISEIENPFLTAALHTLLLYNGLYRSDSNQHPSK